MTENIREKNTKLYVGMMNQMCVLCNMMLLFHRSFEFIRNKRNIKTKLNRKKGKILTLGDPFFGNNSSISAFQISLLTCKKNIIEEKELSEFVSEVRQVSQKTPPGLAIFMYCILSSNSKYYPRTFDLIIVQIIQQTR